MSKAKSFITGVICGGAVAGLAVLFSTPSSGKDMRGKLKEKGNDIKKTLCTIHFLTGSKTFLKTNAILRKRFWTFKNQLRNYKKLFRKKRKQIPA